MLSAAGSGLHIASAHQGSVVSKETASTVALNSRALPQVAAAASPEASEAQTILAAVRTSDPKAWNVIVAKLRYRDPSAWRALMTAQRGKNPEGWVTALSAIMARFPNAKGLPQVTSPPPGATATNLTPSALDLPLGVNFDLETRWRDITPPSSMGTITSAAMSSDSDVLAVAPLGSGSALYLYDAQKQTWTMVYAGYPTSTYAGISAGQLLHDAYGYQDYREAWVILRDASGTATALRMAVLANNGQYAGTWVWPTQLPNGDQFAQIASGSDGTAWALGTSGNLYSFNGSSNSWTQQQGPSDFNREFQYQIAVGSAGNVWVSATVPGPTPALSQTAIFWWNGQSWQVVQPALTGFTSMAGVADGTLWLDDSGKLYTIPPGTTTPIAVDGPASPVGLGALEAGSRFRAVTVTGSGVGLFSYGLADQPARGYSPWSSGQQAAYDYINTQLGFTWQSTDDPTTRGLRQQYTNQFAVYDLSLYQSEILNLTAPSNVAASDWQAVRSQVLQELSSVLATYRMFDVLTDLDQQIAFQATSILSQTNNLVQLSTGNQSSTFGIIFTDVFEAALAGIAAAVGVASGGAGIAAAIAASGIDAGISALTGGGSGTSTQTTYTQLQTQLITLFNDVSETNSQDKGAILSDPGRFLPVGAGILDGTLYWPPGSNQKLAQAADNGFELAFLKVLTPVQWTTIVHLNNPQDAPYDETVAPYDFYAEPNKLGGQDYWYLSYYAGLFDGYSNYPTEQLLSEIERLTGATKQQLLTNQYPGWFQVAQA